MLIITFETVVVIFPPFIMSFEIHREPLYRRYHTNYSSAACCYGIVYVFAIFLLPLIIAYNSSDFWYKEGTFFEQPKVSYTYNTLFQATTYNTASQSYSNLYFSSNKQLNSLLNQHLRIGVLTSAEKDDNRDGIVDTIEMNLLLPLAHAHTSLNANIDAQSNLAQSETEQLVAIDAVMVYDVSLSTRAKYTFQTASHISYAKANTPLSSVFIEGNLLLQQQMSLYSKGGYVSLGTDDIMPVTQYTSAQDVSVVNIMQRALSKNLSLSFSPTLQYGETSSTGVSGVSAVNTANSFHYANITLIQHIPIQQLRYTPTVSEVLKWAWIQYISFFAVIAFLIFRINSFVFRHQLLYTKPVVDIKLQKVD